MPTGQQIITNALTTLGIVEQGGSPSASDSADALIELNDMWSSWSIDEGLIFAVQAITKALTGAVGSYTIGSGAAFNVASPSRIYAAFITTSSGRNEIKVVDREQYYSHNDLSAAAVCPDEVYPNFNIDPTTGYATIYLWPIQSGTPTLELTVGCTFTAWALATSFILPPGYQDAINYALAWRLIPRFGDIVSAGAKEIISGLGSKAEDRIREMNVMNRKLPTQASVNPQFQQAAAAQGKV